MSAECHDCGNDLVGYMETLHCPVCSIRTDLQRLIEAVEKTSFMQNELDSETMLVDCDDAQILEDLAADLRTRYPA